MKKKTGKEPPDPKILEEFSKNLKPLVPVYKDLADKIGTSATMIKKYVEGISLPRCDIFLKISKTVDKSMEILLGEEPPQKQSTNDTEKIFNDKIVDILIKNVERLEKENANLKEELEIFKKPWDGKTFKRKNSGE